MLNIRKEIENRTKKKRILSITKTLSTIPLWNINHVIKIDGTITKVPSDGTIIKDPSDVSIDTSLKIYNYSIREYTFYYVQNGSGCSFMPILDETECYSKKNILDKNSKISSLITDMHHFA